MNRKQFLTSATLGSVGAALCGAAGRPCWAAADEVASPTPPAPTPAPPATAHTCEQRIAFAERWVQRFMGILDERLDQATREAIMETNGQRCFVNWLSTSGTTLEAIPFAEWAERVRASGPREDIRVDGTTVYFQFTRNTTGVEAPAHTCLCDLLESAPSGISPTYCHCSVGYVRELFSRRFGAPVRVTLLDSVLRGGDRCRFKVDLA